MFQRFQMQVSHRSVLAIAVPIMLANVSQPLLGIVDTAVIGRLPEPHYIGAIAVGSLIFSFLYWGFGFLRMGTGGLAAQAYGAADPAELAAVLARALLIAAGIGLGIIALGPVIGTIAFHAIQASDPVEQEASVYFSIRIWSAPFTLMTYVVVGWFVGIGKTRAALVIALFLNGVNMALDAVFVLGLGMTADGIALGTLIAEVSAALLGLGLVALELRRVQARFELARILDRARLVRMVSINFDIMVRSLLLILAFSWFTAQAARMGDVTLAANAVLMHFFTFSSFLIDGFAHAAEALVGQAVGARARAMYRQAVRLSSLWAGALSVALALAIIVAGPLMIDVLSTSPEVRVTARQYLLWVAVSPLLGVACFQLDGIFTGATQTRDMRNMMIVSFAGFIAAWWLFTPLWGNHGLWLALDLFFLMRTVTLISRLPALERRAFGTSG
jgi:multidrug resistance protein, MATE family